MRVKEDVPRWDFPAIKPPSLPSPDLGSLPSISDLFGSLVISSFFVLVFYIGYRLLVMPEGKYYKIKKRFMR
jgi:hypothetical protein